VAQESGGLGVALMALPGGEAEHEGDRHHPRHDPPIHPMYPQARDEVVAHM